MPFLADNIELIGRYEGSGFHEAPYLVKRGDGQVIQVSRLLFLVATALQDEGTPDAVARNVSEAFGRTVSAENVVYLVDKKLRPTGILATPESEQYKVRANPLLALRLRLPLVPERLHRRVTTALTPLFRPAVWIVALAAVVGMDAWILTHVRPNLLLAASHLIYHPQLLLPLTALTVAMGCWHEIGHATAARYGGASPGAMGAGIYLIWPVFYTDVTDSYRLDRRGRLRVDVGGVYFNVLFMLVVGAAYFSTGSVLFLVFLVVAHTETLRQFLPFVRLDGYYIVSDLAGVPNLFTYLRPTLARITRALPFGRGGRHSAQAAPGQGIDALTKRARVLLTIWACITVPVLAVNIVFLAFFAPRLAGAAWGSAGSQLDLVRYSLDEGNVLGVLNGAIGALLLMLPAAGMTYIVVRLLARLPGVARRSWDARPVTTAVAGSVLVAALLFHATTEWPDTFAAAARPPAAQARQAQERPSLEEAAGSASHGLSIAGSHLAWGSARVATAPPAPPVTPPASAPEPPPAPAAVPEPPDAPAPEPEDVDVDEATGDEALDGEVAPGAVGAPAPVAPPAQGPAPAPPGPTPPATTPPPTTPPTTAPPATTPPTTEGGSALDPLRELLPFLPA